jgi:anthranilate phosphoribosyltransferase
LTVSPEKIDYLLKEAGIAFLFAPTLHPAMGALPDLLEILRLPCFAIGMPPPAKTKAAVVLILKL